MAESAQGDLASAPTAPQLARFALLTPEERFRWPVDLRAVCHELATPEVRASWHAHEARQR